MKGFQFYSELSKHTSENHGENNVIVQQFVCKHDGCRKRFSLTKNLNRHVKEVHQKGQFLCKHCSGHFLSQLEMIRHIRAFHKDLPRNFPCKFSDCHKLFATQGSRWAHERRHHKSQIKKSEETKEKKIDIAGKGKLFKCKNCSIQFDSLSKVICHFNTTHRSEMVRKYSCSFLNCDKKFPSRQSKCNHQKMHCKKFSCKFKPCQLTFDTCGDRKLHHDEHRREEAKRVEREAYMRGFCDARNECIQSHQNSKSPLVFCSSSSKWHLPAAGQTTQQGREERKNECKLFCSKKWWEKKQNRNLKFKPLFFKPIWWNLNLSGNSVNDRRAFDVPVNLIIELCCSFSCHSLNPQPQQPSLSPLIFADQPI